MDLTRHGVDENGVVGPEHRQLRMEAVDLVIGQELFQWSTQRLGRLDAVLRCPRGIAIHDREIRHAITIHPLGQCVEHLGDVLERELMIPRRDGDPSGIGDEPMQCDAHPGATHDEHEDRDRPMR